MRPARLGLPPLARQYCQTYRAKHPDDPWQPQTLTDVFTHSFASNRVAALLSLLHILVLILDTITSEISDLLDGFGMWRPGFKPAINGALVSLRRLTSVMQEFIVHGRGDIEESRAIQREIATDYDALMARIFRFAAIPVNWNPGEPISLPAEPKLKKARGPRLTVSLQFDNKCVLTPEHAVLSDGCRLITRYAVYHYSTESGRAELRSNEVRTLRGARRIAARLYRQWPTETFLIYRIERPSRPAASLFPIDYINTQHKEPNKPNKPNKKQP